MPRVCASATKVRFTALSMSSTHMKITITLRRKSTPATPSVNNTAEMKSAGLRSILELSLREHDGPHDRGEEQDARDLEGDEVGAEQRSGHGADDALLLLQRGDRSGLQLDRRGERRLAEHAQLQHQCACQDRRGQESECKSCRLGIHLDTCAGNAIYHTDDRTGRNPRLQLRRIRC